MNYYLSVFKKYADFSGRAQRAEYWYFSLFNGIIGFVFELLNTFIPPEYLSAISMILVGYALLIFIPSIAVTVRRLHDVSKSGWMILVGLIPLIGPIWLLVLFVSDSTIGDNKYGPNPKGIKALAYDNAK